MLTNHGTTASQRAERMRRLAELADLASDAGENREYDRALLDVATTLLDIDHDDRAVIASMILSERSPLHPANDLAPGQAN